MKKVYIILAEGFETIEALTPVDVMKRCGIEVVTISISGSMIVKSSHGVVVEADDVLGNKRLEDGDVLILPGGYPGYANLCNSKQIGAIAKEYYESGKILAAICGAPTVLALNEIAKGKKITCHHSVKDKMGDYEYTGEDVVKDGNLITGIGAGRSLEFSLYIASLLIDASVMDKVKHGLEIV